MYWKTDRLEFVGGFAATGLAVLLTVCVLGFSASDAYAYKLRPTGTEDERRIVQLEEGRFGWFKGSLARWVMDHFTHPVHEELTNRILGCDAHISDKSKCLSWGGHNPAVTYGVQWNDNPPFAITATDTDKCKVNEPIRLPDRQPDCWITLFYDAEKNALGPTRYDRKSGKALIYRVHFGDMQFLHSMASWDGESMADTKKRILMWAEFAYKTALEEISPLTEIQKVSVSGFDRLFRGNGYDVQTLFTRGVPGFKRGDIPSIAFGSLLHMIQDGFAKGHVTRDNPSGECPVIPGSVRAGRVLEFHAFGGQDSDRHGAADSRDAMEASLMSEVNALTVGRTLKQFLESKTPWPKVNAYLDQCVYPVDDDDLDRPAGPGKNFLK